jgi:hypothetical protein
LLSIYADFLVDFASGLDLQRCDNSIFDCDVQVISEALDSIIQSNFGSTLAAHQPEFRLRKYFLRHCPEIRHYFISATPFCFFQLNFQDIQSWFRNRSLGVVASPPQNAQSFRLNHQICVG